MGTRVSNNLNLTDAPIYYVEASEAGQESTARCTSRDRVGSVAELVVDRFQPVDVDDHHRQHPGFALQLAELVLQPVHQQGAVGQAGERVVQGHPGQFGEPVLADPDVPAAEGFALPHQVGGPVVRAPGGGGRVGRGPPRHGRRRYAPRSTGVTSC